MGYIVLKLLLLRAAFHNEKNYRTLLLSGNNSKKVALKRGLHAKTTPCTMMVSVLLYASMHSGPQEGGGAVFYTTDAQWAPRRQ